MCDIYFEKCVAKGCNNKLEIHLGDYNTPRKDIEVFCPKHLPIHAHRTIGIIFEILKINKRKKTRTTTLWYMGYLSEKAKKYWGMNSPNLGNDEYKIRELFGEDMKGKFVLQN